MKYLVIWQPEVEDELARLWLDGTSRQMVSLAANRIDGLLQTQPNEVGESRANGRRILLVPPLAAIYRVIEVELQVRVLRVWYFSKRDTK